jgi:hypothetical protein
MGASGGVGGNALVAALKKAADARAILCEETLLAVWLQQPELFGRAGELLLDHVVPVNERERFRRRIQRALEDAKRTSPLAAEWPAASPRLRRILGGQGLEARQPATLLLACVEDSSSLLSCSTASWMKPDPAPDATETAPWAIEAVSGASAGRSAILNDTSVVRIARDEGHGAEKGSNLLLVADRSVPRLQGGAEPLSVRIGDRNASFELRRGTLQTGPDVATLLDLPATASVTSGKPDTVVDVDLGPDGLAFRFGSTLFRIHRGAAMPQSVRLPQGSRAHRNSAASNIFLSYARKDIEAAQRIVQAFEAEGYTVWWDNRLVIGQQYDQEIDHQLQAASCVIALWSHQSVQSQWVRNECARAKSRGTLMPLLIELATLPLEFLHTECGNLVDWNGDRRHPSFRRVADAISARISGPPNSSRTPL